MAFQRENQRISASEILQALADGEEIRLNKCTISGELDINRLFVKDENFDTSKLVLQAKEQKKILTLSELIAFHSCRFEENVCFANPWDKPDELEVVFKRDAAFNSSVFSGQTRFSGAVFHGLAGFDGCKFEAIAAFRRITFQGRAMFRTTEFSGYGLFDNSVFRREGRFTNTCFCRGGNFTNVRFEGGTDFSGVYSQSKSVPIYESVSFSRRLHGDDETFWRFIKQASQEAGYYQLAGESFYNERCANLCRRFRGGDYDELKLSQKIGRVLLGIRLLPELIFGRLLFGYGERPIRVLMASVMVMVICAVIYSLPSTKLNYRDGPIQSQQQFSEKFMDGLYFSTITFTTLGFGDMYPDREHLPTRAVAMIEAISGASLMALFIVCLAKRYSRG